MNCSITILASVLAFGMETYDKLPDEYCRAPRTFVEAVIREHTCWRRPIDRSYAFAAVPYYRNRNYQEWSE